ncbi:MAG: chorismate synthase, partial [Dehalococcoidia bacterium]
MTRLRFLTAGESHGKGLTVIIEGLPAGLPLSEADIASDLSRRQGGYGRGGRMKIEQDHAEIMAGVRHGLTLGSPVSLWIENRDWVNWTEKMAIEPVEAEIERVTRLRPGHADLPGAVKYGFDDVRNVLERASARETAARVATGGVAKRLLAEFGVTFHSHTLALGGVRSNASHPIDWDAVEENAVRSADPAAGDAMVAAIDAAKHDGDTL